MYIMLSVYYYPYSEKYLCITETKEQAERLKKFYLQYDNELNIKIKKIKVNENLKKGKFPFSVFFFSTGELPQICYADETDIFEVEDYGEGAYQRFSVHLWAENEEQAIIKAKQIVKDKYNVEL